MNKYLISIARYVASCAVLAGLVALCHFLHANASTAGFAFLLAILIVSAAWGLRLAIFLSLVATLAYNFFFLPPVGTFTIADPQNWSRSSPFCLPPSLPASSPNARVMRRKTPTAAAANSSSSMPSASRC